MVKMSLQTPTAPHHVTTYNRSHPVLMGVCVCGDGGGRREARTEGGVTWVVEDQLEVSE